MIIGMPPNRNILSGQKAQISNLLAVMACATDEPSKSRRQLSVNEKFHVML
jgi:hypothetical protein